MTNPLRCCSWTPLHLPILALLAFAGAAVAQCEPEWLAGDGLRGVNGRVNEMVAWDPDGTGPAPEQIVMVGEFTVAGSVMARNVVAFDPVAETWTSFGDGVDGEAYAAIVMPNGDLVVAGEFDAAGAVAASGIARWGGSSWAPLGAGVDDIVRAMTVLPNGDLVVGGSFTQAGAVTANGIVSWDGSSWSAVGGGVLGGGYPGFSGVFSLLMHPSGDLYIGGDFLLAGSVLARGGARWDGSAWHPVGQSNRIQDLALASNGNVLAVAYNFFGGASLVYSVAEWNGTDWLPLAPSTNANGTCQSVLGEATGAVYVGGWFDSFGASSYRNRGVVRLRSGAVEPVASGGNDQIHSLFELDSGDVLATGSFRTIGDIDADRVARWDGTQWHAVGQGFPNSTTNAVCQLPTGEPVIVGYLPNGPIHYWTGTFWSPFGSVSGEGLAAIRSDRLLVAGGFNLSSGPATVIAWGGSSWTEIGDSPDGRGRALVATGNGGLVCGGSFATAGGVAASNIAQWDGSSWQPMGPGLNGPVYALARLPDGDIVAGGAFTYAGSEYTLNIARWDGAAWYPVGPYGVSHRVDALAVLPNGDLVAGGRFTSANGIAASRIARWNGTTWSGLGEGADGNVLALAASGRGELYVGGAFESVGNTVSSYFARYAATCPADAVSYGAGCGALAGVDSLRAESRPWLGTTFVARASGLPSVSLAIAATGLTAMSLPLTNVLPQALPGCQLLVSPALFDLYVPVAGEIVPALTIPDTIQLAGQTLRQQVVVLELDAQANLLAALSSSALTLTIGSF